MKYTCRTCGAALLMPVVVLERMPLTDDFVSTQKLDRNEYLSDIRIFQCGHCGLVQNPMDFDHEGYYQDYQYSSGHSAFVQRFMGRYAEVVCDTYVRLHQRRPVAVLEIGSGDGEQLKQFRRLSVQRVLGIEPSEFLAHIAEQSGIPTIVDLFGADTKDQLGGTFDVCLSSYTLDHVRNPIEYLQTAHALLSDGGVLAFEVHDLEKIIERTEYCLFEHEHTTYLSISSAERLIRAQGFSVVAVNPLAARDTRGNSLIVIAQKVSATSPTNAADGQIAAPRLSDLNDRIKATVAQLDGWISSLPISADLVGFGVGGRGVMTLAAIDNSERFVAMFDSNYKTNCYLTPKTRIPIVGPEGWSKFQNAYCLVFSYGYLDEIKVQLGACGFKPERIFSLADFFPTAEND